MSKKVLAVIPARGGSKGIKNKNIFNICGLPLIAYTIKDAIKCSLITDLMVSTDSHEIKKISEDYGVLVPFIRPPEISGDDALAVDVLLNAVSFMEEKRGYKYDYVIMLQPTSPMRGIGDIDTAINMLIEDQGCESVVSMVDVGANHPARMYRMVNGEPVSIFEEGITMQPRQNLEKIYIRSGSIYAFRRDLLINEKKIIGGKFKALIVDKDHAINIDTMEDMEKFRGLIEKIKNSKL